jgi:hypothetical protein
MVREPDTTMQTTRQDNQLMSKHRVLSFKPQLRPEWRDQHSQNETEQPDHSASLGDSMFSVHTGTTAFPCPAKIALMRAGPTRFRPCNRANNSNECALGTKFRSITARRYW